MSIGIMARSDIAAVALSDRIFLYNNVLNTNSRKFLDVGGYRALAVGEDIGFIDVAFQKLSDGKERDIAEMVNDAIKELRAAEQLRRHQEKRKCTMRGTEMDENDITGQQPTIMFVGEKDTWLIDDLVGKQLTYPWHSIGIADDAVTLRIHPSTGIQNTLPAHELLYRCVSAYAECMKNNKVGGIPDIRTFGDGAKVFDDDTSAVLTNLAGAELVGLIPSRKTKIAFHEAFLGDSTPALMLLERVGESSKAMTATVQTYNQWYDRANHHHYKSMKG